MFIINEKKFILHGYQPNPLDSLRKRSVSIYKNQVSILYEDYNWEYENETVIWSSLNFMDNDGIRLKLPLKIENKLTKAYPILKDIDGSIFVFYVGSGNIGYSYHIKSLNFKTQRELSRFFTKLISPSYTKVFRKVSRKNLKESEIKKALRLCIEELLEKEKIIGEENSHIYSVPKENEKLETQLFAQPVMQSIQFKALPSPTKAYSLPAPKPEDIEERLPKDDYKVLMKKIESIDINSLEWKDRALLISHYSNLNQNPNVTIKDKGLRIICAYFVDKKISREEYLAEMKKVLSSHK